LDASYPEERLAWMLEDSHAPILLTQEHLLRKVPSLRVRMIAMDTESGRIGAESTGNPIPATVPANLAYVMYTSGSSGIPKGVAVEHRAIARLALGTRAFTVTPNDVFVLLSPVTFDASTLEIWAPFLNGARLALFPASTPLPAEIGSFVERAGVTVLWLTAGLFHQVIETELPRLHGVRQLLTGGDVVSQRHVRMLAQAYPECTVINGYGPTENTTFTACHAIQGDPGPLNSFPIGKPISNTTAYVLDAQMNPVPVGVSGELFTGGMGLARGYLGAPDWTAEKFLPNPFSKTGGERLYRTGDRARWQAAGTLDFLGRFDFQVKLRGFRIELEEIQAVLAQVAGVRQALVMLREYDAQDKRLVAYVAAEQGTLAADEAYLRGYIKERLPEYMVPAAIVIMGELPLTHNGKIDRRALPLPEYGNKRPVGDAPRNPVEEIVAGIWCQILKLDHAGVHDSFFDLGGHSLLATQVISRIRRTFQVELSLTVLFENPTIAALTDKLQEEMGKGKKNLLPPLRPVNRQGFLPLSFAQQRLWFLQKLQPESVAYNVSIALRLQGELRLEMLERVFNELIRRHEILRTRLEVEDQAARQLIIPAAPMPLPLTDLSVLTAEDREAAVQLRMLEEVRTPFDLVNGALIRGKTLRLTPTEHVLLVTVHHIACDGWSMGIMMSEIGTLYEAYCAGQESPLPELTLQYADYAAGQREWLQGEVLEEQLLYWKKQLAHLPALEIPIDYTRTNLGSEAGAALDWTFSKELSRQLKELSRREGVTLFMTLLTAFQLLLARYSRQEDVAVGTPIAGRRWAETEKLIGFFVNTLVLRTNMSGAPTFRQLLAQVRATTLEAHAFQDIPFEKLVEELRPERDLSRTPFFQVLFLFQNAPEAELHLPGIKVSRMETPLEVTKFELALMASESGDRIGGGLAYRTGLFAETRMRRFLGYWENLLTAIASDPDVCISDVQFLSAVECRQLLTGWNRTEVEVPRQCLHRLFEQQAARTPDAVAVRFAEREIDYRQLNERANQVARYLQRSGVVTETLVGICMERSLDLIVSLLGILKAGAAYVPLDPALPAGRIGYMLEDSRSSMVLTERALLGGLPQCPGQTLCLEEHWEQIAREATGNLETPSCGENLAYVIYTSGSTGTPKGVMVPHQGLVNVLDHFRAALPVTERDAVLATTTLSFDIAALELYLPLLAGGKLVVAGSLQSEMQELAAKVEQEGISVLQGTPTLWNFLATQSWGSRGKDLKILCGGEALEKITAERLLGISKTVWNVYGPTETTVWSSAYPVRSAGEHVVAIGQPIGNTRMYVLDDNMQPVPVGVAGDLFIGGMGLARGYVNRADLTGERFVPDPFAVREAGRLYATGDVARWKADGNLEYAGRKDYQVKVRGYRIELGEIEAALLENEEIEQAVVVASDDGQGGKMLVAYVVTAGAKKASSRQWHEALKSRLPEYMVPSHFMVLDKLPQTANGKIDRKALPGLDRGQVAAGQPYVAPEKPIAKALAQIWESVLQVERVGIHDNFFQLGGHSLLGIQVIARVRKAYHVDLPLRSIFAMPTIARFSDAVEEAVLDRLEMLSEEEAAELLGLQAGS
jgi:amino acid adenylation domain-containing protein